MGVVPRHLHLLAMEQSRHPIRGDVITFGQQKVYASVAETLAILKRHGVSTRDLPKDFDTRSRIPGDDPRHTNAATVFKLLGAENVYVADASDYEAPDFVFDLNEPVADEYEDRFDVVFDYGTLEHVFDVPTGLANIVKMLKPGGLAILGYPTSNAVDHGFYSFSPTLLFDFFAAHGFGDFDCYLNECSLHNLRLRSKVFEYAGVGGQCPVLSSRMMEVCFWATLQAKPDSFTKPMQSLFVEWWKRARETKPDQDGARTGSALRRLARRAVECIPSRVRPEIIDSALFSRGTRIGRRDNLRYVGKF